jgi:hypothetical protein
MATELLFDIGQQGWHEWPWVLGGALVMAAALRAWRRATVRGLRRSGPGFFVVFGGVCLAAGLVTLWDHQRLQRALQDGRAQVLEGVVNGHLVEQQVRWDVRDKRWRRSTWEAFRVGDTAFGFTRDASAAGFRNAEDAPVVLHDGQWLRLHFVEDVAGDFSQRRILRVERRIAPERGTACAAKGC